MAIHPHVTISLTNDSVGLRRLGFGTPLMLSHTATWAERVRTYTDLAGVAFDFPSTTSPEYLGAQAVFSQTPAPKKLKIGRASLAPTQVYVITPAVANATTYTLTVKGDGITPTDCTYVSDSSATASEITGGLELLISAVVGNNYSVVDSGTALTITADNAGGWFSLAVSNPVLMQIEQAHVDPGVATDLAAIQLEDDDWYMLLTNFNSNGMVLAADAWINAQKKQYCFDVNETAAITTVVGNGDTLDDIKTLLRPRTEGIYHPSPYDMNAAAWVGRCLSSDPGSITWKYKQLNGVPAVHLTSTQRANLVARSANFYEPVNNVNIMVEGTTADGDFIDVQRGLDWIEDDMSKRVFEVLASANKIPFTDLGITAIQSAMEATLEQAVARSILAASPPPVVTVPLIEDISQADKLARTLPDMKFSGTLAGAIHKVNMTGVVSV